MQAQPIDFIMYKLHPENFSLKYNDFNFKQSYELCFLVKKASTFSSVKKFTNFYNFSVKTKFHFP